MMTLKWKRILGMQSIICFFTYIIKISFHIGMFLFDRSLVTQNFHMKKINIEVIAAF